MRKVSLVTCHLTTTLYSYESPRMLVDAADLEGGLLIDRVEQNMYLDFLSVLMSYAYFKTTH